MNTHCPIFGLCFVSDDTASGPGACHSMFSTVTLFGHVYCLSLLQAVGFALSMTAYTEDCIVFTDLTVGKDNLCIH